MIGTIVGVPFVHKLLCWLVGWLAGWLIRAYLTVAHLYLYKCILYDFIAICTVIPFICGAKNFHFGNFTRTTLGSGRSYFRDFIFHFGMCIVNIVNCELQVVY